MRISTSITLNAQRQLANTSKVIARSLERLSSGNRVDSPRDDQAAFSMITKLESQVRGLRQGVQNINLTQGLLETADSAISTQIDIVQKMRELAVQASSGTLSSTDRTNINKEVQQLLAEYQRIVTTTQFNGQQVLDGSMSGTKIQLGPNPEDYVSLFMKNLSAQNNFTKTVGLGTFNTRTTLAMNTGFLEASTATELADLNGDGILDIIDTGSSSVSVFLGIGDGTFGTRQRYASGNNTLDVAVGDINGDGVKDILTADSTNSTVSILIGNGDGTFQTRKTVSTGSFPTSIELADLNKDGKLDLISLDGDGVSILLGNGNGTFQTRTTFDISEGGTYGASDLVIGDLNRDGILDIGAVDNGGGSALMIFGRGDGTFSAVTTASNGGFAGSGIQFGDMNNDGVLDIVTSGVNGTNVGIYSVMLNNGNGTFQAAVTASTGVNGATPARLRLGDMNNDGNLDVVGGFTSLGAIRIVEFLGNGNGTLQTVKTFSGGSGNVGIALGDLNRDGVLDIVDGDQSSRLVGISIGKTTIATAIGDIDVSTQTKAQNLISILDSALTNLKTERSNISALHNRLDHAASANLLLSDSLDEARSKSKDVDIALETAELVRSQILQQAQVAVLSQANLQMQVVLKLLDFNNNR